MTITITDIEAARERGRGVVLETPTLPSTSFSRLTGCSVLLKAENLQRTGSFKIRGAMNAISLLPEGAKARGVVAASAGNHAQGVALAAAELGIRATVFMPEAAAIPKVSATIDYGADVKLGGADLAEATDLGLAFAADTGATMIHPYDDPSIIAGQGTVGLELLEQASEVDTVVIPVGGGGLISGSAIALKTHNPRIRIVGVSTDAVPTYYRARETGSAAQIDGAPTVADGIAVSRPADICFDIIEKYVDDLVLVTDRQITESVALLLERAKYLVEPSGAAGVAALLNGQVPTGATTAVVLSGGNVDLLLIDGIVRHGLEARGRFASFSVVVPDEPGHLARVVTVIGDRGGNILSVDHHREGTGLEFGTVRIDLAIETRSQEHARTILDGLSDYDIG
ncbi:MAG: threonine ammonia-lyase [Acidimicrobiia bacterium]|nr:threonine ammonia-lyase [Acidimicrobiia bacterium]